MPRDTRDPSAAGARPARAALPRLEAEARSATAVVVLRVGPASVFVTARRFALSRPVAGRLASAVFVAAPPVPARRVDGLFDAPRPCGTLVRAFVPAAALPRAAAPAPTMRFVPAARGFARAADAPPAGPAARPAPPVSERFVAPELRVVFVDFAAPDDVAAPADFARAAVRLALVDVVPTGALDRPSPPAFAAADVAAVRRAGEGFVAGLRPAPPVAAAAVPRDVGAPAVPRPGAVFVARSATPPCGFDAPVRPVVDFREAAAWDVDAAPVARLPGDRAPRAAEVSPSGWRMGPVAPTVLAPLRVLRPGALPRTRAGPAFFVAILVSACDWCAVRRSTAPMQDG